MISLSKLVSGEATVSRHITYEGDDSFIPAKLVKFSRGLRPVIVWNVTRRCNLRCVHCYADASSGINAGLSTDDCMRIVETLAEFDVPLILFSGGEPLLRKDIIDIAEYAKKNNIKCVLSTNGTLISRDVAEQLKDVFEYVGVSIDGLEGVNDRFRGVDGAFEKAFKGLLNVADTGVLTGIRFTVTRYNVSEVPEIINLLRENDIPRFCLYHLVPSGRAGFEDDITREERRRLVEYLLKEAEKEGTEIMTVDNPADGVFTYLKLKEERNSGVDPEKVLEFLSYRGGDSSGIRLACIDSEGDVHPNQFWWDYNLGNVLKMGFDKIWLGEDKLLQMLRNKTRYLEGKCGVCRYKEICGGFRVRALRYGYLWGEDPDCYLSHEEVLSPV
jgi:radical SAM protein with 4Fe4S-binding SPASM domain